MRLATKCWLLFLFLLSFAAGALAFQGFYQEQVVAVMVADGIYRGDARMMLLPYVLLYALCLNVVLVFGGLWIFVKIVEHHEQSSFVD